MGWGSGRGRSSPWSGLCSGAGRPRAVPEWEAVCLPVYVQGPVQGCAAFALSLGMLGMSAAGERYDVLGGATQMGCQPHMRTSL